MEDLNFIQSLGISKTHDTFTISSSNVKVFRKGDIIKSLDDTYLVEDVRTTSLIIYRLNWWGKLLHYFNLFL